MFKQPFNRDTPHAAAYRPKLTAVAVSPRTTVCRAPSNRMPPLVFSPFFVPRSPAEQHTLFCSFPLCGAAENSLAKQIRLGRE